MFIARWSANNVDEDYDSHGHAQRIQRKVGTAVQRDLRYGYDDLERLTSVHDVTRNRTLKSFTYATSNSGSNWRKGKIIEAIRNNYGTHPQTGAIYSFPVTETFTYAGPGGSLTRRIIDLPGALAFDQSWAYDDLGNATRITYPRCTSADCSGAASVRNVDQTFSHGDLTAVNGWASLGYHENGMLARVSHANGVTDTIDMDANNQRRPANISVAWVGDEAELGPHHYDGAGNLVRREHRTTRRNLANLTGDALADGNLTEGTCGPSLICDNFYLYDTFGRLKTFHGSGGEEQRYVYDNFGNLIRVEEHNGQVQLPNRHLPTSANTNHLVGAGISYDVFGRLDQWGTRTYEYDELDMLVHLNGAEETYLYTADDERLFTYRKTGPGQATETWTLRDLDGRVLRTYEHETASNQWTWKADHIYRGSQLLATATDQAAPKDQQHFTLDHLGSARLVTGSHGRPLRAHHYYGFGQEYPATSASIDNPEKMRFTGHERDQHGPQGEHLDYMHARYCSPHFGRFMTMDPAQESANPRQLQSWNRYSYVLGNPLRFVDPTGEIVSLSELDEADQGLVLQGLEAFTGNTYTVDDDGNLQLESTGEDGSAIATSFLADLISSDRTFSVRRSLKGGNRARISTGSILIDTKSFSGAKFDRRIDPQTFNLGSSFVHEAYHVFTGELDRDNGVLRYTTDWTGPVVDFVNTIREERGLPLRANYIAERSSNGRFSKIGFITNPRKPHRVRYVQRRIDK